MSGNRTENVGSDVGKWGPPDIKHLIGINNVDTKCRECRVSTRVESSAAFKILQPSVVQLSDWATDAVEAIERIGLECS
jgi:hypothetical protein